MTEALGRLGPRNVAPAGGARGGGRLAVIDGLRLLAALFVAMYHYTGYAPGVRDAWGVPSSQAWPLASRIGQFGWLGVELFFMISGFVICMSSWGRSPGAFFRSRITRLFPAYWAAILITSAVLWLWPVVRSAKNWQDIVLNLSMLQMAIDAPNVDGVYWTLWSEAMFYCLFSFLIWRGLTLRRAIVFGYAWLIASMLSRRAGIPVLETVLQPEYAPFFVSGIALYLIYRFGPDILLWGLLGASFLLAQYWTERRVEFVGENRVGNPELSTIAGAALVTLFFVALTLVALGYTSRIQWRWLTTAGLLTYPFYLLHENIGWTIIYGLRDLMPRPVLLVLVIVIMLAASYVLHRLIEKPLARLLKHKMEEASSMLDRPDRLGRTPPPPAAGSRAGDPVPPAPPGRTPSPARVEAHEPEPPIAVPAQRQPAEDITQSDTLILPRYRPTD